MRTKYNSEIINKNLNNPEKMWCALNEIIYNKKRSKNTIKALYSHNGNTTTNMSVICDTFNTYFKDVGKILHDQIRPTTYDLTLHQPSINETIRLFDTCPEEVALKLRALKKMHQSTITSLQIRAKIIHPHFHQF